MKLIDCLSYVEETRSHINQDYPVLEISFLTDACGEVSTKPGLPAPVSVEFTPQRAN